MSLADIRQNSNKSGNLNKTAIRREYTTLHGEGSGKTLDDLVKEEAFAKNKSSYDEVYARNITKMGGNYKGGELGGGGAPGGDTGFDEEDQVDMTLFVDKGEKLSALGNWERDKQAAVREQVLAGKISSRCWWWVESDSFDKSFLVGLGDHVTLTLVPTHLQLLKNSLLLTPVTHALSLVEAGEEAWQELRKFKSSIRRMFEANGKAVIFMETSLQSLGGDQCKLECIPVKRSKTLDAPMYFSSAMNETLDEFKATHSKIIKVGAKHQRKSMQYAVPKGFDYFSVEFGKDEGFAMLVDEPSTFKKDFGLDVIAGMVGIENRGFGRKEGKRKDRAEDAKQVGDVGREWSKYDWTTDL